MDAPHKPESSAQPVVGSIVDDYRRARAALQALADEFSLRERSFAADVESAIGDTPGADAGRDVHTLLVYCLGPFRVVLDGEPLNVLPGGRPLAVLKFLATFGGRPTPRDLILEAFWPEVAPSVAGNRLRVAIHSLRRMIPHHGDEIIAYKDGLYQLYPNGEVVIDADRFEAYWHLGQKLEGEGRVDEAASAYGDAERLYCGDYLEQDLFEDWTLVRRASLRDAYLTLLLKLAVSALEQGNDAGCITRCHKVLGLDPCSEEAYQLLIVCHGRRGDRATALRWYAVCETTLRHELSLTPAPATAALRERLLAGSGPLTLTDDSPADS